MKAQLKDKHGFFLSPANELKELSQYATQVFAAHPKLPEHTGSMPQLEPAKLARQKASIKPGKAVPKGSALAAAWKLCARPVSQALARCCDSLDTRQHLDDGLTRAADLCLTPKPGKSADKPSQLRPLGILCPDAKGLAGAAKELLEPLTLPYMRPLPQFAYLPGRGLSHAQSRVVLKGGQGALSHGEPK